MDDLGPGAPVDQEHDGWLTLRSLSVDDVAQVRSVTPEEVEAWDHAGLLYRAHTSSGIRYPAWQFAITDPSGGTSPEWLREVVAAIDPGLDPLLVDDLMVVPARATAGQTPIDWLACGGSPDPVIVLLRELAWRP
ncbi:hypothetical protein V6N00_13700 [Tersicoccus sp. MR15.9]|uniref:hypothetical protein n=1 Tax=Tersicoccus mangrovi TaxID=3121635 RepID=UPI002FE615BF